VIVEELDAVPPLTGGSKVSNVDNSPYWNFGVIVPPVLFEIVPFSVAEVAPMPVAEFVATDIAPT
jgi:hypothetical protein